MAAARAHKVRTTAAEESCAGSSTNNRRSSAYLAAVVGREDGSGRWRTATRGVRLDAGDDQVRSCGPPR
jgi:hypothetical protein